MVYVCPTFFDCVEHAAFAAAKFSDGLKEKILIFCEDKLTLSVELSLAEKTGGSFSTEVTSFGRYLKKRSDGAPQLSKEGSAMAVKKLLSKCAGELKAFKNLASSPSLSTELAELIAQLKSAKISAEELSVCALSCPKNMAAKLSDVALIFSEYEKFLQERGLSDGNTALSLMPSILLKDEDLPSTRVIFVGFSSVTKQSCEVVKTVFQRAKTCDFYCVDGDNTDLYTGEFCDFAKKLTAAPPVKLKSFAEEEALNLLGGLFDPTALFKEGKPTDKVFLFEADTLSDECSFIAARIRYEILHRNIKYRDIAIAVGDLPAYSLSLKRKLADYEIPYFSDEKRLLSSHPIAKLYKNLLRFYMRGGDKAELKNVISNSLFIPEKTLADGLIKVMTETACSSENFISGQTDLGDVYYEAKRNALKRFYGEIKQKDEAKNFAAVLKNFASLAGVEENAEAVGEKLKIFGEKEEYDFLGAGLKKIDEILGEIQEILGDEVISVSEFSKVLEAGTSSCEISLIPEYYDSVYICDLKDCRSKKYKVLFAAGLGASVPDVKADVALLRDGDIDKLEKLSVKVEPKIRAVNKREKEACGVSLASFGEELFLSYSLADSTGASEIVRHAQAAFSDKTRRLKAFSRLSFEKAKRYGEEKEREKSVLFDYSALRPALFSLAKDLDDFKNGGAGDIDAASSFYLALKKLDGGKHAPLADALIGKMNDEIAVMKNIPPENYFRNGNVSASILETYYACPYKNFLKYGVGVKEAMTEKIRPSDLGNVLHKVAEEFIARLEEVTSEDGAKELAGELFDKIAEEDEYARFMQRADYKYSVSLVKKEAEKLCAELYNEFKSSEFKPVGTEIFFGDGCKTGALRLNTAKKGYRLHGKADRLDAFTDSEGNVFYRIIDYKTGGVDKKIKDESLYAGINLQLYLYLKAFAENVGTPSGAYYYEVGDDFKKLGEFSVRMRGKTLSDDKILNATEKDFSVNKEGKLVNVKIKETKSGGKLSGEVADETTLSAYMQYAKRMAEEGVNDITDGVIISSPYSSACAYCEYGGICRHDESTDDRTRKAVGVTKNTIVEAVYENYAGDKDDG